MKWIKKRAKFSWSNSAPYFALLTFADVIILLLAIFLIAWLILHYWFNVGSPATYAMITIADKPPLRVNLDRHDELRVAGSLGESILVVEPGKIRFIASPCSGKQCIHTGWLTHGGDFSACLPNKISVIVQGTDNEQFDAITY